MPICFTICKLAPFTCELDHSLSSPPGNKPNLPSRLSSPFRAGKGHPESGEMRLGRREIPDFCVLRPFQVQILWKFLSARCLSRGASRRTAGPAPRKCQVGFPGPLSPPYRRSDRVSAGLLAVVAGPASQNAEARRMMPTRYLVDYPTETFVPYVRGGKFDTVCGSPRTEVLKAEHGHLEIEHALGRCTHPTA